MMYSMIFDCDETNDLYKTIVLDIHINFVGFSYCVH